MELIKDTINLPFHDNMEQSIKILIGSLSEDWAKGLTALKRSQILINKFGNRSTGERINEIIKRINTTTPIKHKRRYNRYFESITPLNNVLERYSEIIIKTEFWQYEEEVCLASLLARFEAVYSHLVENATLLLSENMKDKDEFYFGQPIFVKTEEGALINIDDKIQQLAASLDRNLRFIEYHLKRKPLVDLESSLETFKAGTFQLAGEVWNSIFYLLDKISFFDWYASEVSGDPSLLYYQPRNKNEYMLNKIGGTAWLPVTG